MSVSAVASSPSDVTSLAALTTSNSGSSGIATDLSAFTQAESSGDKSGADAALVQLKSDLASEQTALLSEMMGSADGTSDSSDAGNALLSGVLNLSSNANISSALGDVQNLAAQSGSTTSSEAASASSTSASATNALSAQSSVNTYA